MNSSATLGPSHKLHIGLAEQGKLHALKNNHTEALRHYREAIRLAVSTNAPEIFFRHYSQCVLESLELTATYQDVIDYCEKAHQHYQNLEETNELIKKDWASALERLGVNYWKQGDPSLATHWLSLALATFNELPLTKELLQWLARGFSADKARIEALQKKHHYFVVRKELTNAEVAIPIEKLGAMVGP